MDESMDNSIPRLPSPMPPHSQLHGISDTYIVSDENDRILDPEVHIYIIDTLLAGFQYVSISQYWCVNLSPLRMETWSWTTRFLHYLLQCRLSPNFQGLMVQCLLSPNFQGLMVQCHLSPNFQGLMVQCRLSLNFQGLMVQCRLSPNFQGLMVQCRLPPNFQGSMVLIQCRRMTRSSSQRYAYRS